MGHGVFGSQGQRLGQRRFGRREASGGIVGRVAVPDSHVDPRGAYPRVDIAGVERQGALKKSTCLRSAASRALDMTSAYRQRRASASPAAAMALMRMNSQIDISDILPSVHVPTLVIHCTDDKTVNVEGGRFLAKRIPGAQLLELPGEDHLFFIHEHTAARITDAISEFLTGSVATARGDRVLATVLFTDIVDSTSRAEQLGDQRWRNLLEAHHTTVRRELTRSRGNEVKSLGDGFLATFDGPALAVRCAQAISEAVRPLGIQVRSGLHTGEIEISDNEVQGIAVHIASRVAALAEPGEVLGREPQGSGRRVEVARG
jgi:hypothetical protein